MNYGDEKTVELYVDFLWQQRDYWQMTANKAKDDANFYRKIVDEVVARGLITMEEAIEIGESNEDKEEGM